MGKFEELAHKKVAGVPVIYLAGGAVVILGVVAWKMKPSTDAADPNAATDPGTATANPYDGLASNGTVTVAQGDLSTSTASTGTYSSNDAWVRAGASWLATQKNVSASTALAVLNKYVSGDYAKLTTAEQTMVDQWSTQAGPPPDNVVSPTGTDPGSTTATPTNQEWINDGAAWLVANEHATGSAALAALTKYVNGSDRSYTEQQWVDAWFAKEGAPPEGITAAGSVGSKPVPAPQRQFTTFPGTHVIKGGADNGYTGLAKLYYNSTAADRIDLLQAANTNLGSSGPWSIGTRVHIPAYHAPVYYTTPSVMTEKQILAKNPGLSSAAFEVLNNGKKSTYPKGAKVRVK
jgi:hypothetical protein